MSYYIIKYFIKIYKGIDTICCGAIETQSLQYSEIRLDYSQTVFILVKNNRSTIDNFCDMLLKSNFNVSQILYTNIMLCGNGASILELFTQHQGYTGTEQTSGMLLGIVVDSKINFNNLSNFLNDNVSTKKDVYTFADVRTIEYMLSLLTYIDNACETIQVKNPKNKIKYYKCNDINGINLSKYFKLYSVFNIFNRKLFLTAKTISVENILPILTLKIQYVHDSVDNLTKQPIGVLKNERVISLVLQIRYSNISYFLCLYIVPSQTTTTTTTINAENNFDFEKIFNRKYKNSDADSMYLWKCKNEKHLLNTFCKIYAKGLLFNYLLKNVNYPHILLGFDIVENDLTFLATRLVYHNLMNEFNSYISIDSKFIRFHNNAIILDLSIILKKYKLTKEVTLDKIGQKFLSSTNGKLIAPFCDCTSFTKLYDILEKQNSAASITNNIYNFYENDVQNIDINLLYTKNYFVSHFIDNEEIFVPTIETLIINNLKACILIDSIFDEADIFHLLNVYVQKFCLNIETIGLHNMSQCLSNVLSLTILNGCFYLGKTINIDNKIMYNIENIDHVCYLTELNLENIMNLQKKVTPLTIKNNKKQITGGLNFAVSGNYRELCSIDFCSYYPSLLSVLRIDCTNTAKCTIGDLLNLPSKSLNIFNDLLKINYISCYMCEENISMTDSNFNLDYKGPEIAEPILYINKEIDFEHTKDIFVIINSRKIHYLKIIIDSLLEQRFSLNQKKILAQQELNKIDVENKRSIERNIQKINIEQKACKMMANTMIGLLNSKTFHFHDPISFEIITMFGRKYITITLRLVVLYYYIYKINNNSGRPVLNMSNLSIDMAYCEKKLDQLKKKAQLPFIWTNNNLNNFEDENFDCKFKDQDIIVYVDTDGIKFSNVAKVPVYYLITKINDFFENAFSINSLKLIVEHNFSFGCIFGKKMYCGLINNDTSVQHFGYCQNNIWLRHLFTVIVKLNFSSNENQININIFQLFMDIFTYMYSRNQFMFIEPIKSVYLFDNSMLSKYIHQNTNSYKGVLDTMFVLDKACVSQTVYMSFVLWQKSMQHLNYAKYLMKNSNVFWKIILLMYKDSKDTILIEKLNNFSISEIIEHFYCIWADIDCKNRELEILIKRLKNDNFNRDQMFKIKRNDLIDIYGNVYKKNVNYCYIFYDLITE